MIADNIAEGAQLGVTKLSLPSADRLLGVSTSAWHSAAGGAQTGGDWCEVITIAEDVIALTIGDVSGHGAAVAGTMAVMRAAFLQAISESRVPSDILAMANDVAYGQRDGVIVTAIVAFLNRRVGTLTFANAGHPLPLLLSNDEQAFLEHPPADPPLGIFQRRHAADYAIALRRDAMLVLYTDGVTEHDRDPVRGENELLGAARVAFDLPDVADAIAKRIFRSVRGVDDAPALVLRVTP